MSDSTRRYWFSLPQFYQCIVTCIMMIPRATINNYIYRRNKETMRYTPVCIQPLIRIGAPAHTQTLLYRWWRHLLTPFTTCWLLSFTTPNPKNNKTPRSEAGDKKESLKVKHKQYYRTKWLTVGGEYYRKTTSHQSKIDTPSWKDKSCCIV